MFIPFIYSFRHIFECDLEQCAMVPHPKTVGGPCTKRTKVCCGKSFVGTKRKFVTFQWIFIINTDSFLLDYSTQLL